MRHFIQDRVYFIAGIVEIIISTIMLLVIGYLTLILLIKICTDPTFLAGENPLDSVFSYALNLVIGVEFIKMLVRHTPTNVLEVLVLVTSRQIVVAHGSILQTLLGVIAIILLFAARKYLLLNADEKVSMIYPAQAKVFTVNSMAGIYLPYSKKMSLEQLIHEKTGEDEIEVGTVVEFPNVTLRVVSARKGRASEVEIIKEVGRKL